MSLTLNSIHDNQALRQARALVIGMSPRQRYTVGGGVLAVVAAMLVFVHLMAKPDYTVLYSSLQPVDAQQVSDALSRLAIPYQLAPDGTSISVPSEQIDKARLQLAARGLPHSGQLGFELFDKTNWSGSDFDQQVNYQRALEGELERTIETINGVESARVHLTMAHDSLFSSESRPAKAAVLLTLRDGTLPSSMATAIQHLVASSVDHLSSSNVAVLDANGDISLADAVPGEGTPAQSRMEEELRAKIVSTLSPIVGADHLRASVTVAYDPTSGDTTKDVYDPSASAVLSSQSTSTLSPGTAAAAGVPGTTSNLPKAQAPGTSYNAQLGLSGAQGEQSNSQTFAVSNSVSHQVRPAGTVQRITAAVVVDDGLSTVQKNGHTVTVRQPRSPAELQQFQQLAAAAIGIDPARGDVITVSNLPFIAQPAVRQPAPPPVTLMERFQADKLWLALGGALLLAFLIVGLRMVRTPRRNKLPAAKQELAAEPDKPAVAGAAGARAALEGARAPATGLSPQPLVAPAPGQLINVTDMLSANPDDTPSEMHAVLRARDELTERVKRDPAVAGRLVQVWMNRRRQEGA